MPDAPGTTLNTIPRWVTWLANLRNNAAPLPYIPNSAEILAGGPLPMGAPQMVGHPSGLRDREKAILSQFDVE